MPAIVVAALMLAPAAHAQGWEFDFIADVGVIWTDNLFLEPGGQEDSETIYTLAPEFQFTMDGQRIVDTNIRYRPELYFYSDNSDFNEIFHILDATVTAALVREALFLNFNAVNFQSIVTPEAQFLTSNVPVTGNRVDSTVFELRPYWDQELGFADVLLEVAYRKVDYSLPQDPGMVGQLTQPNESGRVLFDLNNESRQQGFAWGLNYEKRRLEYESVAPWEYEVATATLGFWVASSLRLFGTGGGETPIDQVVGSSLDADFWEAGFQYRPSDRLDLVVAAGERSYGNSYRLSFEYTLRRGNTQLTYFESPSTRGELVTERRPLEVTDNLDNFLDRPLRSDRFLRRRGEWITNVDLARSQLTLRLVGEARENRSTAVGDTLADERYVGAALRWSWTPGQRTTIGIGADIAQRDAELGSDDLTRFNIDLTYRLASRTSLRVEVWHSKQTGDAAVLRDYNENQVRLLLRFNI